MQEAISFPVPFQSAPSFWAGRISHLELVNRLYQRFNPLPVFGLGELIMVVFVIMLSPVSIRSQFLGWENSTLSVKTA